tara:strand:- start:19 stop:336 length:318 start_codon:yes stop_codon:yes gene_type:complete
MSTIAIGTPAGTVKREMTVAEEAQRKKDVDKYAAEKAAAEAKVIQDAKDAADAKVIQDAKDAQTAIDQASGNTKLLNLGLTQAEATALTGYTPPPPPEPEPEAAE